MKGASFSESRILKFIVFYWKSAPRDRQTHTLQRNFINPPSDASLMLNKYQWRNLYAEDVAEKASLPLKIIMQYKH